jgi:hypothetical protein
MPSATSDFKPSSTAYFATDFNSGWSDLDHPQFYFDSDFKHFCHQKLDELEHLRAGWDYQGAPPIDKEIIAAVRVFVDFLPQHIATRPMIVPMSSGNVQLEWHHGRSTLELEFESPEKVHYLKWDPDNQIEVEDVIPVSQREQLIDLIRWFMKGMLSGG